MYYYLRDRCHSYQTWYKNKKSNCLLCHRNIYTLRKLWATYPFSESNNLKENIHSKRREFSSVQFSSVSRVRLCDPMDCSMPGLHHWLPEFTQAHVYRVGYAIQPSHPLSSPSPPAFNLSQQVAKVLEFQPQSFQWIFRTDFLSDGLVGTPCCSRDFKTQESSPTTVQKHQFFGAQFSL